MYPLQDAGILTECTELAGCDNTTQVYGSRAGTLSRVTASQNALVTGNHRHFLASRMKQWLAQRTCDQDVGLLLGAGAQELYGIGVVHFP